MPTVAVYDMTNKKVGDIDLSEEIFGVEIIEGFVHQAVVVQMASWRLGTHSTKTPGDVAAAAKNLGGKKVLDVPAQVPAEVLFGVAAEQSLDLIPATTRSACRGSNVVLR